MKSLRLLAVLALMAAPLASLNASLEAGFQMKEVYAFPNPARPGEKPTIHVEVGQADAVRIHIVDLAGRSVEQTELRGSPRLIDDGAGSEYAYEFTWDTSSVGAGVYVAIVTAQKDGHQDLQAVRKIAVVR